MFVKAHRRALVGAALALLVCLGVATFVWRDDLAERFWAKPNLMTAGPLGEQELGDANAPVTIIEYSSMTCSHCATFTLQTFPVLKERYVDTGKVRFIFREFPLDHIAAAAAMLARCAPEGKFFTTVDALFASQKNWAVEKPLEPLFSAVRQVGMTQERFDRCLADQKLLDGIDWVRTRAIDKFKVNSTPTFFIDGTMHAGNLPLAEFERLIAQKGR